MTAFALDFRPDRLIVASDTLGYTPDRNDVRPLGFVSKILPIPHLRAVVFSRGMLAIAASTALELLLQPTLFTIEQAAAALPQILSMASDVYAAKTDIPDWRTVGMLEFVLAGWSPAENRMRIWSFENYTGYQAQDDGGQHYGLIPFPRLPAHLMPAIAGAPCDADLVRVIEAAGRLFAEPASGMGGARVGGEVIALDITPDGMAQRVLHRFADYDETMAASAAVVARIGRGDLRVNVGAGLVPAAEMMDPATGRPRSGAPANDAAAPRKQTKRTARSGEVA